MLPAKLGSGPGCLAPAPADPITKPSVIATPSTAKPAPRNLDVARLISAHLPSETLPTPSRPPVCAAADAQSTPSYPRRQPEAPIRADRPDNACIAQQGAALRCAEHSMSSRERPS